MQNKISIFISNDLQSVEMLVNFNKSETNKYNSIIFRFDFNYPSALLRDYDDIEFTE